MVDVRPGDTFQLRYGPRPPLGQLGVRCTPEDFDEKTALYLVHEIRHAKDSKLTWWVAMATWDDCDPSLVAFGFAMAKAFALGRSKE